MTKPIHTVLICSPLSQCTPGGHSRRKWQSGGWGSGRWTCKSQRTHCWPRVLGCSNQLHMSTAFLQGCIWKKVQPRQWEPLGGRGTLMALGLSLLTHGMTKMYPYFLTIIKLTIDLFMCVYHTIDLDKWTVSHMLGLDTVVKQTVLHMIG